MRAVFLDRDGVINRERGDYTWKIEDFEFVPGLFEALNKLKSQGYCFIVITNQGGIAKGLYTHEDVAKVHAYMINILKEKGIEVLDIFYSPYHNQFSESLSRKPDSLMLEKACAIYSINKSKSVMIGDSERDIIAANKIGVRGVKVSPNQNINEILDQING
ncbi:MAG: D-glycero-alpha-D-manno-heptose-1,7-bisphosphate 7-phosphatase [Salibacteraceae bacterium]